MSEIIDINVYETTEDVTINVTESVITVNINKVTSTGGGGGTWGSITGELSDQVDLQNALDLKVDFIVGKGLSTNDFTDALETKLNGIEAGAEVNVNADWNAISGDAQILNKPSIPTNTSDLTNDGEDGINPFITALDLSGLVPYTGATQDVNLGEFGLQTGNIEFDLTPTAAPTTVGSMSWNDNAGTVDLKLKGGNVTLQIGQETVARVVNKTATNITLLEDNYQVVRITGAIGGRPKVDLALADNDLNSATTLGLVTETILNNEEGFITTSGQVQGINTTGSIQGETWADGDIIYLSGTVAGRLTNIKPAAPIHTVIMGIVEYAHITQGKIFVKVDNGYELEELHNVSAIAPNNNEVLTYDTATLLWKPKTVSTALGYTPVNQTRLINTTSPLLGGGDLSADKTLSIQQSTSLQAGYLSSTDWSTFNNKQDALGYTAENQANKEDLVLDTSSIKYPTNNLVKTNIDLKADIASPTFTGTVTTPSIIVSDETINTIASFDAIKNIKSLPTVTYPDLTELSYVKGTTSTIQTQLNGKQATLTNPITGTGTTNKIPKFTGSTALGNSLVSDDGTTVTVEGLLAATKSVAAGYVTTNFTNLASNGYVQHQFVVGANVANLQYAPTLFYKLVTNEANTPIILAPNSTTALTVLPSGASTFASTLQATRLGLGAAANLASYLNVIANTASVGQIYFPPSAVDYTGTLSGMLWNNTSEWKFYDGVLSSVNRLLKLNGNTALANANALNVVTSTGTGGNLGTLKAEVAFSRFATSVSYTVLLTDVGFGWIIAVTSTAAARTITLPLANTVTAGFPLTVKDESGAAGTNNITIARAGADTIDGATSNVINTNYGSRTVYSDGVSKWFII